MDCQYPASSVYKLYDRIGRCYYKLKRMDQAVAAFKKALGSLEVPSIAEETKAKLKKDIEKIMRPLVAKVGANAKLEEGLSLTTISSEGNQPEINVLAFQ